MNNRTYYNVDYASFDNNLYITYKSNIWSGSDNLHGLYLYEENGNYFEFFTGINLGKRNGNFLSLPESTLRIDFGESLLYGLRATLMSATSFATHIKSYSRHEKLIRKAIIEYFNRCHWQWLDQQAKQQKSIAKEKESSEWIDDILSHRK